MLPQPVFGLDFNARQAQQKAVPNKAGVTESPRKVNTNDKSKTPGSRGDLFSDPDKLAEHLAFVRKEREKAEETVKLQRKLETERQLLWAARVEAAAQAGWPINALGSLKTE